MRECAWSVATLQGRSDFARHPSLRWDDEQNQTVLEMRGKAAAPGSALPQSILSGLGADAELLHAAIVRLGDVEQVVAHGDLFADLRQVADCLPPVPPLQWRGSGVLRASRPRDETGSRCVVCKHRKAGAAPATVSERHERRRPLCDAREGAVRGERITARHSRARRPAWTIPGGSRWARPDHGLSSVVPSRFLRACCQSLRTSGRARVRGEGKRR